MIGEKKGGAKRKRPPKFPGADAIPTCDQVWDRRAARCSGCNAACAFWASDGGDRTELLCVDCTAQQAEREARAGGLTRAVAFNICKRHKIPFVRGFGSTSSWTSVRKQSAAYAPAALYWLRTRARPEDCEVIEAAGQAVMDAVLAQAEIQMAQKTERGRGYLGAMIVSVARDVARQLREGATVETKPADAEAASRLPWEEA